jgi:hypothetical protein
MRDRTGAVARGQASESGSVMAAVAWPFALTRAGLVLAAWLGAQLAPSWTYFDPAGAARGWSHHPSIALDAWGRYDTFWYLDIAAQGYRALPGFASEQSHLAFFPLYPWLVRAVHGLLPAAWQGDLARYLTALAVANACAVAGLAAVHALVREAWGDAALARRTVLYLLLFPGGFYLSCAYSESLFLLLAALALLLAQRGRWGGAALCALLLGLTRPSGLLAAPAVALVALGRREERRPLAVAAALAAPAGFTLHAAHLAHLTGDPLAVFHAQAAWGRALSTPWRTLLAPAAFHTVMGPLELALTLAFLALGLALLAERRWALGAFALLALAPVLFSGTLMSGVRFLAVAFPCFAVLGRMGRSEPADRAVVILFGFAQATLFVLWSRFYWVA